MSLVKRSGGGHCVLLFGPWRGERRQSRLDQASSSGVIGVGEQGFMAPEGHGKASPFTGARIERTLWHSALDFQDGAGLELSGGAGPNLHTS